MTLSNEAATMVAKTATAATYGGSASAVFFGLTANEFAALTGAVVAVVGLMVNIWFKAQHLALARRKHAAGDWPLETDE